MSSKKKQPASPQSDQDLTSGHPPTPSHRNDLFPEFVILWLLINQIEEQPRRLRKTPKSHLAGVMRSIERFGFRIPILVAQNTADEKYRVVDGHVRLEAARQLGAEKIPCIVVDDLPDVDIRRLSLSLNKLQETGEWGGDELRLEINEIIEIDGGLEFPGFELPEIEAIQFGVGEPDEPDPADDLSKIEHPDTPPVTQPGDLWVMNDHRLLCGSARDGAALAAVLDGQVADAVFTDPPYNLKINGHVRGAAGGYAEFAEASGEMTRDMFTAFLIATLGNVVSVVKPGAVLFICMDWRHVGEMTEALEVLKLRLLSICVWVKTNPGMGSLYRSQHEFVFVARREGAAHQNNIQLGKNGRNRSNVWPYAGATGGCKEVDDDFGVHPTVKPIRMVMDALLDVTAPGDLVVDPFLGSGTTLLAAERTGRRCIGVEIESAYVDLTIRRWQAMTGGDAIHAETGAKFDSVARDRQDDAPPGSGISDGGAF